MLAAIATSGLAAVALPAFADNAAVTGSLSRYVKRKRTESIETYVPPVLAARDQLIRVGRIMRELGSRDCTCLKFKAPVKRKLFEFQGSFWTVAAGVAFSPPTLINALFQRIIRL